MREKTQPEVNNRLAPELPADTVFPLALNPLMRTLYEESQAAAWQVSFAQFRATLERSADKGSAGTSIEKVENYLRALHLKDLALAAGCAAGCEAAWEHFVAVYRGYLRTAAGAILRCPADSPAARELADSIFGEVYGTGAGKSEERSLFRYFHGRSSLKTWLRAVLSQRHIDQVRAARRHVDLDDEESAQAREKPALVVAEPQDPHRDRYLEMFRRALDTALRGLEPGDRERLRWYYAEEQTLAAIGKKIGEHESSVSRSLERIRRALREKVEALLRAGFAQANGSMTHAGLSDAEMALCFRYAAEDAPIDLDQLLASPNSRGKAQLAATRRKAAEKPE